MDFYTAAGKCSQPIANHDAIAIWIIKFLSNSIQNDISM